MRVHLPFLTAAILCGSTMVAAFPAAAAMLSFTGTQRNQDDPAAPPPERCAPAIGANIKPDPFYADGTSNLGSFQVRQSHCSVPPPPTPFYDGIFEWTFDLGGSLLGTYSGMTVLTDTPGVLGIRGTYVITSGTGRFQGATGGFITEGTLRVIDGKFTAEQRFDGSFQVPDAIPEPGSWALMILGLGAAGMVRRSQRNRQSLA